MYKLYFITFFVAPVKKIIINHLKLIIYWKLLLLLQFMTVKYFKDKSGDIAIFDRIRKRKLEKTTAFPQWSGVIHLFQFN